jgi:hypothetical protein
MASVVPKKKALPIPNNADLTPNVFEIFSVWYVDNAPYVTIKASAWKDPAAYGIMIADLTRHIADAYWKAEGRDKQETFRRILEGFNAEIEFPTDEPSGKLIIEP